MSKAFAVIAVTILLLAGALAVGYAAEEGGERYETTNESWTADPGNTTTLDYSNIENASYTRTVDVRDDNGSQLVVDVDYTWNQSNGTITALQNGSLADGDTAYIDYTYRIPTTQQTAMVGLWARFYELGAPLIFVLMLGVMLGAVIKLAQ